MYSSSSMKCTNVLLRVQKKFLFRPLNLDISKKYKDLT